MSNKGKVFLIPSFLSEDNSAQLFAPLVIDIIKKADYFLVEEIRTARRFISKLATGRRIEDLHFFQVDKMTRANEVREIFASIPKEADIGIISEAGCPGIADPGAVAVEVAYKFSRQVVPLPGPSSIFLALMASGFSGQRFCFHGYLPIPKEERIRQIRHLEKETLSGTTQIFMETPYRNNQLLEDLLKYLSPSSILCIASNITGRNEFIQSRRVSEWKQAVPDLNKIPTIFLTGSFSKK